MNPSNFSAPINPPPPPRFSSTAQRRVRVALAILFGGGLLAHGWAPLRGLALAITTPLLLLANAAVLWAAFDENRAPRLRAWCLGAWLLTVALEMAGVATGRIFGAYHYGATLRGQVAGVPLLIGLNWVALLLGAISIVASRELRVAGYHLSRSQLATRNPKFKFLRAVGAALLLTGFDWVMEPVAVALDYWQWAAWPVIPAQNYAAWFVIAFGLALLFEAMNLRLRAGLAQYYFGAQLLFFVALRLIL